MTTNPIHSPALPRTWVAAQPRAARPATPEQREKARQAQLSFDFDAEWAALPPDSAPVSPVKLKGSAGYRLQSHLRTTWPDALLREFARDTLKAQRISSGYLDALRVVLGNQADAEREGYTLEQNIRVDFASERTMRTINDQLQTAGITTGIPVGLGSGRGQTVLCFVPGGKQRRARLSAAEQMNEIYRRHEELAERVWVDDPPYLPEGMTEEDVPY